MKKITKTAIALSGLLFSLISSVHTVAAPQPLDHVVAIVNSGVVLESDINDLVNTVKQQALAENQSLPSDTVLRTQAIEKLINDSLLLQMGERMGVQVSDSQLEQAIGRIAQERGMTVEQFRQMLVNQGVDYERYRESIRTELIVNDVRNINVRRRVSITPQEVSNLVELMKEQTNANVEYRLGHILIAFPEEPTQADLEDAKQRADKVIELLNNGSDFKKIAIASSGADTALDGGDLGWRGINEMPTLFAELVDGKNAGEVFGPVRTGLGFNIIKILETRGKQVVEKTELRARHILIKPSIILSEQKAEQMLADMLVQIENGEADFDTLAKEHSEGPTASRGGDLGWADPANYDPAFKEVIENLEVDQYAKPFRSSFGWHLVQLTGRRTLDATQQNNENRAYQLLFNRKFGAEAQRWMKETRDAAYIEIMEE
ncbi:peptidylprolyl isomerase SurA [Thalassotalea ponticola]|uniref:peptidylprolyl isomerase SurA n=1 Tax=Thalassotalea ponticola TaxID=1523392 RepID=UPI0025B38C6C|nr:peptidylprolyl isomerase SurA [Thalassotalea ponticola]MDN3653618.1 peptidylprolyl isomerase SurA [Thalassotalea ponticola]